MLLTNILLGVVIFFLAIIFGSLATIERKVTLMEYGEMSKLYSSLMGKGRKVKHEKEFKNEN